MLAHKVEIYIPRNTDEQEMALKNVFIAFCQRFGGGSVNPVLGGWIDMNGALVTDKIGIVYSYTKKLTTADTKFVKGLAVEARETLREDAITVVIDGVADFY